MLQIIIGSLKKDASSADSLFGVAAVAHFRRLVVSTLSENGANSGSSFPRLMVGSTLQNE